MARSGEAFGETHPSTFDTYTDESGNEVERTPIDKLAARALEEDEKPLHVPARPERITQLDRSYEADTRDT